LPPQHVHPMMSYKKIFYTLLFFIGLYPASMLAQESPVAGGSDGSGSGGTISYSVGQVLYTTDNGSTGSVAKGVQQPYEVFVVTGIAENIRVQISAFPNPALDYLTLQVSGQDWNGFSYQLYDLQGKLMENKAITSDETRIIMSNLPVAAYFLKVNDSGKEVKTFKIIKN